MTERESIVKKLTVVAVALLAVAPALADEGKANARATAIAPFVDEQTLLVVHVDVTRIDADRLSAKLTEFAKFDDAEAGGAKTAVGSWVANFTKAGGKDFYAVVSLADWPQAVPFFVVPTGDDTDAGSLSKLFQPFGVDPKAAKIGDAVVIGHADALRRLKGLKPADRPELVKAFAAAGDKAIQAVLVPTADNRRVIEEMMPKLPKEVGGGSIKALTRGVLWAALGVDATPKASLNLVVQSQDAATAKAFASVIADIFKALAHDNHVREVFPNFEEVAALVTPKATDERATFSLQESEFKSIAQPLVAQMRESAGQTACAFNLRQIGIAMHNYADANKSLFPAHASYDKDGRPLLSWRVHLLPFISEEKLYKEFHLDEPWDSEHNKKLIPRMPKIYRCPNQKLADAEKTTYVVPVGKETAFPPGPKGLHLPKDFKDGTSNTILVVDADNEHAVIWTKPDDLKYDAKNPFAGLVGHHRKGFLVALGDGSARFVSTKVSKETVRAAFTPAGNDTLGSDWLRGN